MANEEIVVPDTTIEPVVPPQGETAEQKAERLEATNKKLYERVKIAEPLAKEYKKLKETPIPTPEKPKVEDELISDVKDLKSFKKMFEIGQKNKLTPDETESLIRYAGTVGKDPSEALKDDDFKDLLDVRRKRARVANAIPSSSSRSNITEGKSFKDMTKEEREANWGKIVPPQ